jgi:hypothetical protein
MRWMASARLAMVSALLVIVATTGQAAEQFSPYVDPDGTLSLPADFRSWTYLGSWIVDSDEEDGGADGIHNVYTQPSTVEAYRKTGQFPDGAVLVKELLATETGDMTTGRVSHATATEGWFVMIKDTQGRFKGNGLWGDGWRWALFNSDDPATTVTEDYKAECLPCHVPAEKDNWIYVRGYPELKK